MGVINQSVDQVMLDHDRHSVVCLGENNPALNKPIEENMNETELEKEKVHQPASIFNPRFVLCVLGIFGMYLTHGVVQEKVMSRGWGEDDERFRFPLFLLAFQCLTCLIIAFIICYSRGELKEDFGVTPHFNQYGLCAFTYLLAMACSNTALNFVSYPIQALVKSTKPIPIMILGGIINKFEYTLRHYICISVVLFGMFTFMHNGNHSNHKHSKAGTGEVENYLVYFGLGALLLSLLLDGLTGSLQDKLRCEYPRMTQYQIMLYMNVWALLYLAVAFIFTGELSQGISFCQRHNDIIYYLIQFGLCSGFGQILIFYCILNFGALVLSIVTTTRKFTTIILSTIIYRHTLNTSQYVGLGFVVAGIGLDTYFKTSEKKEKNNSRKVFDNKTLST